jgi:hypothetical protein
VNPDALHPDPPHPDNHPQRARDFARHWALPKPLTLRLHNFFEYAAERDVARAETALLAELPLRMRLRLLGQLYAGGRRQHCCQPLLVGHPPGLQDKAGLAAAVDVVHVHQGASLHARDGGDMRKGVPDGSHA